jgi:hypothetical protein
MYILRTENSHTACNLFNFPQIKKHTALLYCIFLCNKGHISAEKGKAGNLLMKTNLYKPVNSLTIPTVSLVFILSTLGNT